MRLDRLSIRLNLYWSVSSFPRIAEPLYLFVFTQFRTQNRCALLLELL